MTTMQAGNLDALRTAVRGEVVAPDGQGYEEARRVWNAQIDRRPAAVAYCLDAADVAAAIGWARAAGVGLSVRGGAHNTSGSAVHDDELMINLARCNHVEVDPAARRARVGGGALLADLDAATQAHGLATPGGMISHTGVGGLTLGGGMGWLTRAHGLSVDNLTGAEVVLADGSTVWASETEHPDLFWALRGGGGNFGVVTVFEFRLFEVGPIVNFGIFFWDLDRAGHALRACREFALGLPDGFNLIVAGLNAPPAPFVPEQHRFAPGIALILAGFGPEQAHAEQAERLRATLAPSFDFCTPMPYTALQQLMDEGTRWGQCAYEKGTQLPEFTDQVIDVLVDQLPRRRSPHSLLLFYLLEGGYCAADEDATAYGGTRTRRWATMIVGLADNLETWTQDRDWVRGAWAALQPHSLGIGDYINNMVEFDDDRIRASYGAEKFARLTRIKSTYDPDNVFRRNVNIPPAARTS